MRQASEKTFHVLGLQWRRIYNSEPHHNRAEIQYRTGML